MCQAMSDGTSEIPGTLWLNCSLWPICAHHWNLIYSNKLLKTFEDRFHKNPRTHVDYGILEIAKAQHLEFYPHAFIAACLQLCFCCCSNILAATKQKNLQHNDHPLNSLSKPIHSFILRGRSATNTRSTKHRQCFTQVQVNSQIVMHHLLSKLTKCIYTIHHLPQKTPTMHTPI